MSRGLHYLVICNLIMISNKFEPTIGRVKLFEDGARELVAAEEEHIIWPCVCLRVKMAGSSRSTRVCRKLRSIRCPEGVC